MILGPQARAKLEDLLILQFAGSKPTQIEKSWMNGWKKIENWANICSVLQILPVPNWEQWYMLDQKQRQIGNQADFDSMNGSAKLGNYKLQNWPIWKSLVQVCSSNI